MATTTVPIPLLTLAVGTREFGPASVDDAVSAVTLTIDRTVVGGLNTKTASTTLEIGVWQSDDNGASWQFRASAGLVGGVYPRNAAGDPYVESNVSVELTPGTGRRVKAVTDTGGTSVAVSGSLVIA
jgi:hypothetical protein